MMIDTCSAGMNRSVIWAIHPGGSMWRIDSPLSTGYHGNRFFKFFPAIQVNPKNPATGLFLPQNY
jgi:hypothetical protein